LNPPNVEQVWRSNFRTKALPISMVSPSRTTEHSAVCSLQPGMVAITRWTADPHHSTGQRNLWPEREWLRASIFLLFFWSSNTMVTCSAWHKSFGLQCNSTRREAVRKTKHPRRTRLVRPIGTDLVHSQDRIAKKKAPSTRSTTWARVEAWPDLLVAVLRKEQNAHRNLGVMAFCRFGGGSLLSKAFNKAQMAGSSWELPST
jgi:hypothetical protein